MRFQQKCDTPISSFSHKSPQGSHFCRGGFLAGFVNECLFFCSLENVQYPYQLYIAPSTSSTERPSPNGPDRPFQCPTCGVRFTRIQNLKQHMLIHSGEEQPCSPIPDSQPCNNAAFPLTCQVLES